jgi:hypothetical protein
VQRSVALYNASTVKHIADKHTPCIIEELLLTCRSSISKL